MERCGSASGKIGDLKELIAFQEMAKQLQEISKNVCAGPENADLDNLLRDYNNFAESVFQTPSEFEYLIRKMNGLINFWRLRRKAIWKPIRKTGLPFYSHGGITTRPLYANAGICGKSMRLLR